MSALAATLEAYFADRLIGQRHASPHTVAAYRDSWRLLLRFMRDRTGKEPSELDLADLDAPAVGAFLDHLEHERHNSARTRNARLAAIRSFFHYAALRHPEHVGLIARVLAIPAKRCDRAEVCYLTRPELDALVAAPDRGVGVLPQWREFRQVRRPGQRPSPEWGPLRLWSQDTLTPGFPSKRRQCDLADRVCQAASPAASARSYSAGDIISLDHLAVGDWLR